MSCANHHFTRLYGIGGVYGHAGSRVCDMLSRIMGISDQERQIPDLLSEGCSIN
jgi:hypothetical protein